MTTFLAAAILCTASQAHPNIPSAQDIRRTLDPGPNYTLLAIHLGTSSSAPRDLFIKDPSLPERIPVAFGFWALLYERRLILIDTGFTDRTQIQHWGIVGHRSPKKALTSTLDAVGVRNAEVTDVIVTHSHWDHIGGLMHFPGARIWITRRELRKVLPWAKKSAPKLHGSLRKAKHDGRLREVDGLEGVAPGILLVPVGIHTPGFQYVVVHSASGPWIFASDVAPFRANVERQLPSGQASDPPSALVVLQVISDLLNGDLERLVPGHDPLGFTRGSAKVLNPGALQ